MYLSILLSLDCRRLVLLQEPLHASRDTFLQRPLGLVAQHALGLGDVEIPGHAGHSDLLLVERGRLAGDAAKDLAQDAQRAADALAQVPRAGRAARVAGGRPHGAGKVPKEDGAVVCDEKGLAVDLFVVEGRGRGAGRDEQGVRGEQETVRDVADVGEVKEVLVVANLHLVLFVLVGVEEAGNRLVVALAKDAGRTDGAGEELVGFFAVGGENGLFGGGLLSRSSQYRESASGRQAWRSGWGTYLGLGVV